MKKRKNIEQIILLLISIIVTFFITSIMIKNKYNQPIIESLYVFGEKVEIEPNKKVYRIFMDSAKVKYNNQHGCDDYYDISFKNGYKEQSGYSFVQSGETEAYFGINVNKEKDIKQTNENILRVEDYDIFIQVIFNKPLEIDSRCVNE